MRFRISFTLAVLTVLCSCQVAELSSGRHCVGDVAFSIDDARAFFEAEFSAFRTKAQGNPLPSRFSPGDYTPMWEDAEYSVSGSCAAYDVAVHQERSLVAIRSEFGMNGARAERLRVYQKLVVMKNTASGVMGSYILSLIPDVGSDDRRIPQRFLSRGADKGGFSGIAVYTSASSGSLHSVQQFKDGVKVRGVNLDSDEGSRLVRCRKAMSILSGIVILSKKCVTTKAGEDMWDDWYDDGWDYGDADDYTYIGDGIYEDENGDLYMDINGDGVIDAFLLEGSECTPDDDEDDWPEEDDDDWPEDEPEDGLDQEIFEEDLSGNNTYQDDNTSSDEEIPLPDISLFDVKTDFVKYSETKDCMKSCHAMMQRVGQRNYGSSTHVIYLVRENDNHSGLENFGNNIEANYQNAIDCINRHLDAGLLIVAGVDHTLNKGFNEGTIDHWVLIVGREYNEGTGMYEYLYVETGTSQDAKAYNSENRFRYDEESQMYKDDNALCGGKSYTLIEVRPCDGNNDNTISQPAKKRILKLFYHELY